MGEVGERSGRNVWRYVSFAVSILIVVGIFVFAIPKFADYAQVWKAIASLTPLEMGSLIAATIFNLFTYWWANMAALPGLTLGQCRGRRRRRPRPSPTRCPGVGRSRSD